MIHVSDKTISKWETGKGLPDISMIDELERTLVVSIAELLTGDLKINENPSANMKKVHFYICPICGNIITSYVTSNSIEVVKLYPEQDISVRYRKKGHGFLYACCNKHGMFRKQI